ncbi:MAG TPA: HNH endonuclease [Nitrospinota bacterium]|nr:HNH endonuclease [Nitrospinota bacterium]|tara:strand:- start:130088 stop:130627 length:540 start_codon:yes stop_codon:yes gene_type:complete
MENLRALVLNSTYEPLQFSTAKRALVLSLLGKAEVLEVDGFIVRTSVREYRLPTVIRLNRYIKMPRRSCVSFSKKNVFRRDNYTCQYCGGGLEMTIDHVIPRSVGGRSTWDNIVTACRKCNLKKGSRTPEEAGMKLLMRPKQPQFLFHSNISSIAPQSHVDSWTKYISNSDKVKAVTKL